MPRPPNSHVMKKNQGKRALDFVVRCINELEADGYQTWEDNSGDVPEGLTPDCFFIEGNTLTIWFGNEVYKATFRKETR